MGFVEVGEVLGLCLFLACNSYRSAEAVWFRNEMCARKVARLWDTLLLASRCCSGVASQLMRPRLDNDVAGLE
eukprot:12256565-Ditylum_brightwellii.AAC.1